MSSSPEPSSAERSRPVQRTMTPRQLEEARRALFGRPAPSDYLAEWEARIAQPTAVPPKDQFSVLVFRVGSLWLCADVSLLVEITEPRPIHRVPHRSNPIFLGVVNIRGQLRLCGSFEGLLKLDTDDADSGDINRDVTCIETTGHVFPRMIVLNDGSGPWVFPVQEVAGVIRFVPSDIEEVPVTVKRSHTPLTRGVIRFDSEQVAYLDAGPLFATLNRSLQ